MKIKIMNLNKKFINIVSDQVFTFEFISNTLKGMVPILRSNHNWSRASASELSLLVLLIIIICSSKYGLTTSSVLQHRQPILNEVVFKLFRQLYPMYRPDRSFVLSFGEYCVFDKLLELRDEIEMDEFDASDFPFADSKFYSTLKVDIIRHINSLVALKNDDAQFVSKCLDIIALTDKYFPVGYRTWSEYSQTIVFPKPEVMQYLYRKIFRIDGSMFASMGGEIPARSCFFIYSLVVENSFVEVEGIRIKLSSPSIDDSVTWVSGITKESMFIELFSEVVLSPQEYKAPAPPVLGGLRGKLATPKMGGVRHYSHVPDFVQKYKYCVITSTGTFVSDDKDYIDSFRRK